MKQVLDIEQMKHLKELGVDVSKASVYWYRIFQDKGDGHIRIILDWKPTFSLNLAFCTGLNLEAINTFTLQDILNLLPREIHPKDSTFSTYYLFIDYYYKQISYSESIGYGEYKGFSFSHNKILIDAAYEMLCWCVEKGYISTDK